MNNQSHLRHSSNIQAQNSQQESINPAHNRSAMSSNTLNQISHQFNNQNFRYEVPTRNKNQPQSRSRSFSKPRQYDPMLSDQEEDDIGQTKMNIYQRLQNATAANQEYDISNHERRKSNLDQKSESNKELSIDNRIFNNIVLRDKAKPNLIEDFIQRSRTDRSEKLESARMLQKLNINKDQKKIEKKEYYIDDGRSDTSDKKVQGLRIRFKSEERNQGRQNNGVNSLVNDYQEARRNSRSNVFSD